MMAYVCVEYKTVIIDNIPYQLCLSHAIYEPSFTQQLNNLTAVQVSVLLSTTALIWYVASAIRTYLDLLAYDGDIK